MATTLFERIGGASVVRVATDLLYQKVLADERVSSFFKSTDMNRQREMMAAFLSWSFGGPEVYTGRDLRELHKPMVQNGLNDEHFEIVVGYIKETLKELDVAVDVAVDVLVILESTRHNVLNR